MSLLKSFEKLVGLAKQEPARPLNFGGGYAHFTPANTKQITNENAQIAAEGARMYEAAHPGKKYVPGQNGETYEGGINKPLYDMYTNPAFHPSFMQPGGLPAIQRNRPIHIGTVPSLQVGLGTTYPGELQAPLPPNTTQLQVPSPSHLTSPYNSLRRLQGNDRSLQARSSNWTDF